MSGDLYQPHPTAKRKTSHPLSPQSRIPISAPSPLRRWGSLRARGEGDNPPFSRSPKISPEANHNGTSRKGLQRGYSFMERGERRRGTHGVRSSTTAAPRPQNATTEPRSSGALSRAGGGAPQTPTRNRSLSLSLSNATGNLPKSPLAAVAGVPKTPPSSPDTRHLQYRDWDLDSVASTTSGLSVASCDHASVARNGTTFSGRSRKYVVHCSEHSGATGEDYLTPTQRAHKEVKKLKHLLHQTQQELDLKDTDILRLTKEVVELRLYKAALNSPEDKSNSSSDPAVTVREVNTEEHDIGDCMVENHLGVEQTSSCADSGHYEDLTNSSVHSKDSVNIGEDVSLSPYKAKTPVETADKAITVDLGPRDSHSEHQRLVVEYERRLQDLVRTHEEECHLMKQKHNDKVDELLQRLSEVNTRYWELVPDLESAKERIKELEEQLEEACKKLQEQEGKQKQTYLQMYNQGREAAKLENDVQVVDAVQENPSRISVPDLLHQLEVTQSELDKVKDLEYASTSNSMQPLLSAKEAVSLWVLGARKAMYRQLLEARNKNKIDPEITLQFLKSAIYYFLTDKENNQGHLRAIQSILGFTPSEISNIDKARMT